MSDEEINIAIGEACGWHSITKFRMGVCGFPAHVKKPEEPHNWWSLPNYVESLDAMHSVEMSAKLSIEQWCEFMDHLWNIVQTPHICPTTHGMAYISATARQRAIAFLKCINKYKEPTQ